LQLIIKLNSFHCIKKQPFYRICKTKPWWFLLILGQVRNTDCINILQYTKNLSHIKRISIGFKFVEYFHVMCSCKTIVDAMVNEAVKLAKGDLVISGGFPTRHLIPWWISLALACSSIKVTFSGGWDSRIMLLSYWPLMNSTHT